MKPLKGKIGKMSYSENIFLENYIGTEMCKIFKIGSYSRIAHELPLKQCVWSE